MNWQSLNIDLLLKRNVRQLFTFSVNCFNFTKTEPEKNFALESYGNHSKCFDHTDNMWEERSCRQTREWQHWGSGCYKYRCENGRLHILVSGTLLTAYNR